MKALRNIRWSPEKYQKSAVIAQEVGEELVNRLQYFKLQPKRILQRSLGDLRERALLQKHYPDANIICEQTLPEENLAAVDVIFANFFLPWQADLHEQFQLWRKILSPNGLLTFSYLGLDTLKECRTHFAPEHIPHCLDMHDLGDLLLQ